MYKLRILMVKYQTLVYNHTTTWHDSCVALLSSKGDIISLAAERVDRKKHSGDSRAAYEYLKSRFPEERFGTETDYFKDPNEGLDRTGHHLYHASSVYFASPFDNSGILVVDGQGPERGKLVSTTIWKGDKGKLELVEAPFLTDSNFAAKSIGHFYTAIGAMAGMQHLYEEGKTMALAAYGRPSPIMDFIRKYAFSKEDGTYFVNPDFLYAVLGNTFGQRYYGWKKQLRKIQEIWGEFIKVRGRAPRQSFEEISQEDMDTAYAGQSILEEIVLGLAKRTKELAGSDNLCIGGGVALNGVVNSKIANSGLFKNVYVFPASGDDGQALGKLFYNIHDKKIDVDTQTQTAFYGPLYAKKEIDAVIKKFRKDIKVIGRGDKFVVDEVVDRLSHGEVVGRFSGGSETGPRALGHRSILADPRKAQMRDYINSTVKNREWYRPLAPTVLEDESKNFFEMDYHSPFMLFIGNVIPERKKDIPSVTHVDGTARVQTVNKTQDPEFYELIRKFGVKTKIPVLLNTSFNRRNEPIVESPEQTIEAFTSMDLDALVLEDALIIKRK